jgi:hypothetical protein
MFNSSSDFMRTLNGWWKQLARKKARLYQVHQVRDVVQVETGDIRE